MHRHKHIYIYTLQCIDVRMCMCMYVYTNIDIDMHRRRHQKQNWPANSKLLVFCFFFFFFFCPPPPSPPQASRGGLEAASLGSPWPPNSRMRGETLEFLNSLILQFQASPSLTIFCNIITVLRFPNASLLHVTLARSQSSTVIMHGKCNSKEANKMDKPMIFVLASRMACYKTKLLL